MKKVIKEKDGKYRTQIKITMRDTLLVLTIIALVCTIASLFEV